MISPRKREREKNRREKRETKEAELARLGQARQENQSAVWPPEAALASLREIPEPESRIRALAALAPHVQPSTLVDHLREAVAATRALEEQLRSGALSSLAPTCLRNWSARRSK